MKNRGPDRDVDPPASEVLDGSTPAASKAAQRRDLAASLTAALFGSNDDATETDAQETPNE